MLMSRPDHPEPNRLMGMSREGLLHRCVSGRAGYSVARVTAVNRDNYLVRNESGEVLAEISGRLKLCSEAGTDLPPAGD
ncbi:MAG: hypothetical protein SVM79_07370 [Chloroflexota bacterium]|nr:hypothetical protein [Chloroflexota bacterium]